MAGKVIRVGIDALPEPDVVELFDHKFTVKRVTRSVQKALEQVDKKLSADAASDADDDSDKIVALMAEGLNALLAPAGHKSSAKTVLVACWKDDRLSLDQLHSLYDGVQESAAARPT